jgi:hypothetical protein
MKTNFAVAAKTTLLLGTLFAASVPALAVPIIGEFGTLAPGVIGTVSGGVPVIDFCPSQVAVPGGCTAGTPGTGSISAVNGTGHFALLSALPFLDPLSAGTIKDISAAPVAGFTSFPVGTSGLTVDGFLTLTAFPALNFQGNQLLDQVGCDGTNELCLGAFRLTKTVDGSVRVAFDVAGTIIAAGFDDTPFKYHVSAVFDSANSLSDLAAKSLTTDGIYSRAWAGTLTTEPVPEPATVTMLGIAAAAMLLGRLRSKGGSR